LGSSALEAEDLYLLAMGLDRAGQKESAGRLWEKGLALEPGRPELMAQCVIWYMSQNRLAEAERLAGRLGEKPGWEFRAGLDQGTLRSELGDPVGAADSLERALGRKEAATLDADAIASYRKLLARCYLRMAKPERAGDVLAPALAASQGEDIEAQWLASRVALQMGHLDDAAKALRAAHSFRSERPLELEPGPFVGESSCADCHREQAIAHRSSRHNTTIVRGSALAALPYSTKPIPDPADPSVAHTFRRDGDRIMFETSTKSAIHAAVVDFAFGSPDHYVSLVGHDAQAQPYILRLSHYQAGSESGWVRTTGHADDAALGQEFLGKPISIIDGVFKCLFCHTTDARSALEGASPAANDRAIGCERCHGPGANHLRAMASKFPDSAIVNPAHASADGRVRVCGQCHGFHHSSPLGRTDPFWIRYESTTLVWSRCYTESAGTFDCMTCHDPHHDNDRSDAHYNARCLSCHGALPSEGPGTARKPTESPREPPVKAAVCPINSQDGCVKCHMPTFESKPLHATFADHFIRVHPETRPPATPRRTK
jgi:tetratricopeptide (TPR) repeat protein